MTEEDLGWMAPAEFLILWNVRLPERALARLPNLGGVSIRGGTGEDLAALRGCDSLVCLDVNQVRGLHDLGELAALRSLEFLSLYGLPRVRDLPDLGGLGRLEHVQLGSMKGLAGLGGLAAAPRLRTLQFSRAMSLSEEDVELLAAHPALEAFDWFGEDVPDRVVQPVRERLRHLRRPEAIRPEEWFARRRTAAADLE